MKTSKAPFTFVKDGYFYFSRRIPSDLKTYYGTDRIVEALRTKSALVARSRAMVAAAKLDAYWSHLRMSQAVVPGRKFLQLASAAVPSAHPVQIVTTGASAPRMPSPSLTEAVQRYVGMKGQGRGETFKRAAERACGYLIDAVGEKALGDYTRSDALALRDYLVRKGLSGSSVTRVFGSIRSVINFNISELALDLRNPFLGVYYDRSRGITKRATIPVDAIRKVQVRCQAMNEEKRWLIAMVSDSGARLAEIAGLLREDIVLDAAVPHVVIRPHPWRSLKTKGSERVVPLVGSALWAAKQIHAANTGSKFAFPNYNKTGKTNANSASGTLNKWLKGATGAEYTIHGFRHAMRDRLRQVECPSDIADQIGGWTTEGVGHSYGQGYGLEVLAKWMERTVIP